MAGLGSGNTDRHRGGLSIKTMGDALQQLILPKNNVACVAWLKKFKLICLLAVLGALELGWLHHAGYAFSGWTLTCAGLALLTAISVAYGVGGRSTSISGMAFYGATWVIFSVVGLVFTYLMATLQFPLLDENFVRIDAMLGFHWMTWHRWLQSYPLANQILYFAYFSGMLQVVFSIIYFSHVGKMERNDELLWAALISLSIVAIISGIFPALGAFHQFGIDLELGVHLAHLLALRDGSATTFALPTMQGIITFPSYHTVLAILLMHAFRGQRYWFAAVAALNSLMLLSTPTFGGHYLVDMLAGALVAALAIDVVRRMPDRWSAHPHRIGRVPAAG
jgi:hypothetical protein